MIYVDSGIIMRLLEGLPSVREPIESHMLKLSLEERLLLTSRLACLECRCKPLREKNVQLLALYDSFFRAPEIHLGEIDQSVIESATELRANHRWKTPDAIHASTALLHQAAEFWTTDEYFRQWDKLPVRIFPAV